MSVAIEAKKKKKGDHWIDRNSTVWEVLVAQIWTRRRVRPGACFWARGLFRDGPDQRHGTANVRTKKNTKKAIHNSSVTPTHNVIEHAKLDTVAGSAKSIFPRKAFVQGRSKTPTSQVKPNKKMVNH